MNYLEALSWGVGSFFLIVILHLFLMRIIKRFRGWDAGVLLVFIVLPIIIYSLALIFSPLNWEQSNLAFLFLLITCTAYAASFPAAYTPIPTLAICLDIYRAKQRGLTQEEIESQMQLADNSMHLIKGALNSSLVKKGEKLTLSPKGRLIYRLFTALRYLLHLKHKAL